MFINQIFIALVVSTLLISCRSDDDASGSSFEGGVFTGAVSYTNDTENTSNPSGTVQVVKVNELTYRFIFSDEIPEISDVVFNSNETTLLSIDATDTYFIRVTSGTLQITWTVDGASWSAVCYR